MSEPYELNSISKGELADMHDALSVQCKRQAERIRELEKTQQCVVEHLTRACDLYRGWYAEGNARDVESLTYNVVSYCRQAIAIIKQPVLNQQQVKDENSRKSC